MIELSPSGNIKMEWKIMISTLKARLTTFPSQNFIKNYNGMITTFIKLIL
jgi:hypothetical protein